MDPAADTDDPLELIFEPVEDLRVGLAPPAFREDRPIGDVTVPASVAEVIDRFEEQPYTSVTIHDLADEYARYRDRPQEYMKTLEMKRKLNLAQEIVPSNHPTLLWKNSYYVDGFLMIGNVGSGMRPIMPEDNGQMGLGLSTSIRQAGSSFRDRNANFGFNPTGRTYKIGTYHGKQVFFIFAPADAEDEPPQTIGRNTALPLLLRYQFALMWAKCLTVTTHSNVTCTNTNVVVKTIQDVHDNSNIL